MIGFFVFEETPTVENPLILAHSALNAELKGLFYVRASDCNDISSVSTGSEFFGVLDDASGFGACLFVKDLAVETDALLLQKNLHVKGNTTVDGSETVKGNLKVNGQITGKSNVTTLILSASAVSALAAQVALHPKPTPLGVTLESVTVEMKNG